MFLGFANFYKSFIKNFSKITVLLTSILQTTNNDNLSTQSDQNKKNQDISDSGVGNGRIERSIKNLSTIANLAKSKKSKSKINFAKAIYGTDFLTFEAKKAFIHL